jgi:hypothetical protein
MNTNVNQQADTTNTNENWTQRYVDYDKEEPQPRDISNDYIKEEMVGNVRGVFIKTRNLEPNELENSNLQRDTSNTDTTGIDSLKGFDSSTNQPSQNVSGSGSSGSSSLIDNIKHFTGMSTSGDKDSSNWSSGNDKDSSTGGSDHKGLLSGIKSFLTGIDKTLTGTDKSGSTGDDKGTFDLSTGGDTKNISGHTGNVSEQDQTTFGQISNETTSKNWSENKSVKDLPPRGDSLPHENITQSSSIGHDVTDRSSDSSKNIAGASTDKTLVK